MSNKEEDKSVNGTNSNNGSLPGSSHTSLNNSPILNDDGDEDMKDDDNNNNNNKKKTTPKNKITEIEEEEEQEEEGGDQEIIKAIKAEKERLKAVRDQQRKQLADLEKRQREMLQQDQEKSAKERLKFLLERTEIFTHFVSNSAATTSTGPGKKKSSNKASSANISSTPTKRGHITEKEEDEQIMKETMDEEQPHSFNFFTSNPPYIKHGQMRDYQIHGLNWLIQLYERGINGILADEMGLGKTLQTISLLGYLSEYKGIRGPHLIIAPKSTLSGWCREFQNWCPFLRVVKFHGNKDERADIKKNKLVFKKFDVCVTTYEMVIKEKAAFKKFSWRYIIIDEAHRIKNENSVLSKGVRLFNSQFRLLITGTPLQNNLHELWSLLNFLLPDVFSSSEDFDKWFDLEAAENQQEVIDKLHKVLRPFLLRRLKSEVEKSLPPKKEIKLFVGMSRMQKEWYERLLSKNIETVAGGAKGGNARVCLLNICVQLRKACNHPYLFDGAEEEPYTTGDHLITNSGKMVLLDKLLARLKSRGSRVLIFSQWARMVDILDDYMNYRGYKYCRIDGSTDSQTRESYIDAFNKPGSDYFAFLLTTHAGGLGITLNTADIVILFDSDWNPQMDLQAQDRAHRIGQTKPVTVYRFVTEKTMEEKMVEKAEMKLHLDAVVIQQGRLLEQNKALNPDELLSMVRFGADDIFRSKDSTITDEEIDVILQKGEEKTNQINDRLKDLAKNPIKLTMDGNLYDYNGVNYAKNHQNTFNSNFWAGDFKRERKAAANVDNEEFMKMVGGATKKVEKKEKKVKPPKQIPIHDFQFYPTRLTQLYDKETKAYEKKLEWYERREKEKPNATAEENKEDEPDFGDLTNEEQELKEKLLKNGFGNWNRNDFRSFIRGCELYGRKAYKNIAETVETKTEKEAHEYSVVFWKRYKEVADYDKILARIEKGEERILRYKETQDSLNHKISKYKNPWQQLKIQYGIKKNKTYNDEEDIFLVCMMHKLGYGAWEELKEEIRKSPQFRFDWLIQTRTPQELKARCDQLLKYIIKEYQEEQEKIKEAEKKKKEREKKKLAAEQSKTNSPSLGKRKSTTTTTSTKSKSTNSSSKSTSSSKTNGSTKHANVYYSDDESEDEKKQVEQDEMEEEETDIKVPPKKRSRSKPATSTTTTTTTTSSRSKGGKAK
eukprot:gene977-1243_t